MPYFWGSEVAFWVPGWALGRLRRPSPEFGAGCPSWLRGLVPALSSASHCDASGQDTFSAPSSCVRALSRCHVLCAGSHGRWVEADASLFLLKAVFGSSVSCLKPRAWFKQLSQLNWPPLHSAMFLSEPQFLSGVTERSWVWGGRWWMLNSFVYSKHSRRRC